MLVMRFSLWAFLACLLVACGGGSTTEETENPEDNAGQSETPSLAGFWDETTYNGTAPSPFGYRFVSITESGVYTTYNFKLDDDGAIELCIFDKQGTLEFLSEDYFLDTVTYPNFESPSIKQRFIANGEIQDVVYDYVIPPVDPEIATLEELVAACGNEPPVYDFSAVAGLLDLVTMVLHLDSQGFASMFYPLGATVSAEKNTVRALPQDNGEVMLVGLHWVDMDRLDSNIRLKSTGADPMQVIQSGVATDITRYEAMTLEQLLAASDDNLCSEQEWEWHTVSATGLVNVEIKSEPTADSDTTCLVANNTNALTNPLSAGQVNSVDPNWVYVNIPVSELSCSGEFGYIAANNIRLGVSGCTPTADSLRVSPIDGSAPVLMDSPSLTSGSLACTAFANTRIELAGAAVEDDLVPGQMWQPIYVRNGHCEYWLRDFTLFYVDPQYLND